MNFATLRKGGVDPNEVRLHLEAVAREMGHLENRIRELQDQLVDAQRKAANPVIDEATLASALGAQSAAILRSAHEEAGRVTAEAQERSAQVFSESQQRSAGHLIEAQERATALITEAENTAAEIDHDARLAAQRLIDSAKVNGEALIERAREQGSAIVDQANDARRAVLNDLALKRKALFLQIEQLRAARDTLSSFVSSIRGQVDEVLATLHTSDEAARAAALEALRVHPTSPDPTEEELLAGTPLRQAAVSPSSSPDPGEGDGSLDRTRIASLVNAAALEDATLAARSGSPVAGAGPEPTTEVPAQASAPATAPPANSPGPAREGELAATGVTTLLDDDATGTDVVNEIFARLRKATLEERGATAAAPRRAPPHKLATPLGELFQRRDHALEESLAVLTRRVKRALQDDQNVILERLREVKGMITTEFEDEHAQRDRYAEAAYDALAHASAAGVRFAQDEAGVAGARVAPTAVGDCAADLAVTVVVALRKRILADASGDATERANAAYREWRGARAERLCTDAARRAFHLGVVTASQGRSVRFVAAPNDAPCDACALDASAGDRRAAERFPSGSLYPPLHAGCACAVVPS